MYGDDPNSQSNSMLLTTLLSEALANSSNSASTPTSNSNGLQQQTPQLITQTSLPISAVMSPMINSPPNLDVTHQLLLNSVALNQMLLLNSSLQQDILRLSQDTKTFHLTDDGSESSRSTTAGPSSNFVNNTVNADLDKPLDLSTRKISTYLEQPSTSSTLRPSVIRNGFPPKPSRFEPTIRSCGVKRSTSSLSYRPTPDPDVSEHFRRSLSGKWPRRPTNFSHYTVNNGRFDSALSSLQSSTTSTRVTSPTQPRRQFMGSNSCVSQIVIGESEVEEHFRRTFEMLRQNRESEAKESSNSTVTRL